MKTLFLELGQKKVILLALLTCSLRSSRLAFFKISKKMNEFISSCSRQVQKDKKTECLD